MSFNGQNDAGIGESRILIVDPFPIVRQGLTGLINQKKGIIICGEAENAHKALKNIVTLKPDMIIMEIFLEGLSGIELIERIKMNHLDLSILVFSRLNGPFYVERVIRAGADGYITKHETTEVIVEAIGRVLLKESYVSSKASFKTENKFFNHHVRYLIDLFSNRELEVFRLMGQGYGTHRIADELCLSIKTIEAYRGRIKHKMNIKDSNKLAFYAFQWIQNENKAV